MTEKSYSSLEDQYQTVSARRTKEDLPPTNTVEEILKKIVPAKSFLYRNHDKKNERVFSSYLPMDTGTPKKSRRFLRMSYEYPIFGAKTKTENYNDRGYYSVKTSSRYYIQKTFRITEGRKYKSVSTPEHVSDIVEDHLYEDLCYNDVEKVEDKNPPQKPYKVKIQELFHSFKIPFFKKHEDVAEDADVKEAVDEDKEQKQDEEKEIEKVKEDNFYENGDVDVAYNMYDSVHAVRPVEVSKNPIPVEDYLEPIQVEREGKGKQAERQYCDEGKGNQTERQYCDVSLKEDSLLQYIMSLFDTFGMRRETNDENSDDSEVSRKQPSAPEVEPEWKPTKSNMADRPLPVPVENEPYYMNIDRYEAENLLKGEPDGTFILRPSSQPSHAYTLSVACAGAVHNVGVRRRADGRLALGFARRAERSFPGVAALLRHHRRRRLLLVAAGGVLGATTLTEPPRYYQTPSSIPVLQTK